MGKVFMVLGSLSLLCCADSKDVSVNVQPIYLTVAGHIEDHAGYKDCDFFAPKREYLLRFAELMHNKGVPFRLQASYEWFTGVRLCEDEDTQTQTNGVSSIQYLVDAYNFAIDTHQEGASIADATSGNNFADIHWAGEQITTAMSDVTGFQWDNPNQYMNFQAGEKGLLHPEHSWSPSILSGGVSQLHTDGNFTDDMSSMGIWIPSGFNEAQFHEHDTASTARMVYVGSGPNQWIADWAPSKKCHYEYTADFIEALATQVQRGDLDEGAWLTMTFFIPQKVMFDSNAWDKVTMNIERINSLVQSGQVVLTHYEDLVAKWKLEGAQPSILKYEDLDDSLRTCE